MTTEKQPSSAALKKPAFVATLETVLAKHGDELRKVMPRHSGMTFDRFTKVTLYCIQRVPKLQLCTMESVLACIKQCAELGLEPGGVLGHAYLIPFEDKKAGTVICTLIVGYRGMIHLALRSSLVHQIEAHVVYSNDKFRVVHGLTPVLEHEPALSNRGSPLAAYCLARLANGEKHVEVLPWEVVMKHKAKSRAAASGPWVEHEEEMARKTAVRVACKYLPQSDDLKDALNYEDDEFVDGEVVRSALPADTNAVTLDATARVKEKVREVIEQQQAEAEPAPTVTGPMTDAEKAEVLAAEKAGQQ